MKITINIMKKHLYVTAILLAVFIGTLFVIAFGTSKPSVIGHSVGEIDWTVPISILKANDIEVSQSIKLGGVQKSAWPEGLTCNTKEATCVGDCGVTTSGCDPGYVTVSCSGFMGNAYAARGTKINTDNTCWCGFWDSGDTTNTCQNRCCK